jgi:hypothetical protein
MVDRTLVFRMYDPCSYVQEGLGWERSAAVLSTPKQQLTQVHSCVGRRTDTLIRAGRKRIDLNFNTEQLPWHAIKAQVTQS